MPLLTVISNSSARGFGFLIKAPVIGELVIPGTLWSWGNNQCARLGHNDIISKSSPVQIPGNDWLCVSSTKQHVLALKASGTLWSWGNSDVGQLGHNNLINRSSPVQIPGTQWNYIAAGECQSLAAKKDGTLWSWGNNSEGHLGQNTVIPRSSPVQIPGTQWNGISSSGRVNFALALKTDGTLWAWGSNASGQLGDNTIIQRSSPVQIPGNEWNNIKTSMFLGLATKTDGTLWSWGNGQYGTLGNNTNIPRSSPAQIPGTQWNDISASAHPNATTQGRHALARKTDGTLWSWGCDTRGQLGRNLVSGVGINSPAQIPGTQWNDIAAGGLHSLARKTDGTLWSWGYSGNGELGQNNTTNRSSPIQVPGTVWVKVFGGERTSFAIKCP